MGLWVHMGPISDILELQSFTVEFPLKTSMYRRFPFHGSPAGEVQAQAEAHDPVSEQFLGAWNGPR